MSATSENVVSGKVVFVGDTTVGKTSIIAKFRNQAFPSQGTVGADSIPATVDYLGSPVSLAIFDTAGGENYRCLIPLYARFAHVGVIVYDKTSQATFDSVGDWVDYLKNNSDVPHLVVVGNKADLPPIVQLADEEHASRLHDCPLFSTSAVTGEGIDPLFRRVAAFVAEDDLKSAVEKRKLEPTAPARARRCLC
jgi:small GTP-binding protein